MPPRCTPRFQVFPALCAEPRCAAPRPDRAPRRQAATTESSLAARASSGLRILPDTQHSR
jgi:hypothetical protein